ncbi:MAG: hypothetical protein IJS89_06970 [Bacteroidaceae bacterium]|nr:hypothetical protein [Bacteroidaceae bacterium]
MTRQDYSPEAIEQRKAELHKRLDEKLNSLTANANALLRPDPATTRAEQFAATFSRAITIADGALMGYRLVKRLGWLMPKRKKKRR